MRTIEEILAAQSALVDAAVDRALTAEEVTSYEGMEAELKSVQKSDEIRARNAAYNTVVNPAGAPRRGADSTKDTYDTAFWAYVKSGGKANGDLQISNDQSEGVGSQGGLGTGVAQPLGLVTGKTLVTSAANTGLTYEDLVTYQHSVDPAYRDGAVWVMNDLTFAAVRKIKNPTSGDYIYLGAGNENIRGPAGAMPGMLLDFPVVIDQALPAYVNASPTTPAIVFGNINQGYVIRDVKDVQLLVNPYTRMANRQIEFTAWARADGTQQDTNAYMVGTGHA
jgi:hypothetical protein